ncbi:MAG: His/Gly/Thr/Pro-type tRNA ligase C-terminal domain-containing protein, partial [Candidatus Aenigmatarchaeota archaeon]
IFEVFAEEGIGSIAAGGRYDKLIGIFSGKDIPATGMSLGIERIIEVMKDQNILKKKKSKTKVFVVCVKEDVMKNVIEIVKMLREKNISTDFDLRGRNLKRQLEYADSLDIPYAVIVGPNELKQKKVKVRDMKKREEKEIEIKMLSSFLSSV